MGRRGMASLEKSYMWDTGIRIFEYGEDAMGRLGQLGVARGRRSVEVQESGPKLQEGNRSK